MPKIVMFEKDNSKYEIDTDNHKVWKFKKPDMPKTPFIFGLKDLLFLTALLNYS